MHIFMKLLMILAAFLGLSALSQERRYEPGQVWEYQTRPQDAGSLVRIQRIEKQGDHDVFHVSMVGVSIEGLAGKALPHLPVSRETLDGSVTRLSTADTAFPDPSEGIAAWRDAEGGVFTIPLGEIADIVEEMVERERAAEPKS
jgi:hypothetical protein